MKDKKNLLREGLRANKKLKGSFYYFIYEKHIDWAVFLMIFGFLIPATASTSLSFLILKLTLLLCCLLYLSKYLTTWRQLHEFHKVNNKLITEAKTVVNAKSLSLFKRGEMKELMQQFTSEIEQIPSKYARKKNMYRDIQEYLKYDKEDFYNLIKIENQDREKTRVAILSTLTVFFSLITLREIPTEELKNYNRIKIILLLSTIFFIIYLAEHLSGS